MILTTNFLAPRIVPLAGERVWASEERGDTIQRRRFVPQFAFGRRETIGGSHSWKSLPGIYVTSEIL
jgi:hypothetical protein